MNTRPTEQTSRMLYLCVFAVWGLILALTAERLSHVVAAASSELAGSLIAGVFIAWLAVMWLIGVWHLANVLFSWIASRARSREPAVVGDVQHCDAPVAILYTTCNDFDPVAFASCLRQSYGSYEVLICDDGNQPEQLRCEVDRVLATASEHPPVTILHRPDRKGFKAGNMNNALRIHGDRFEYFAVADADEILPSEFLGVCVSRMSGASDVGFAQCAHAARGNDATAFGAEHSIAIAGHWRHFVPARERFGLLPFYGHGAVLRMAAWREVGGFPEIVSEDLALTVLLRGAGYRGIYVPDVVCEESFPPDFSALTRRTGKWVRGTLEFFLTYGVRLLTSRRMAGVEKLDVAFCALALLLPLPFIVIMLMVAALYLSNHHVASHAALVAMWGNPLILAAGLTAMLSPMAYTLAELPRHGLRVFRQLVLSSATYLAVAPHSAWEELAYLATGRASFPVTGSGGNGKQSRLSVRHALLLILGCLLLVASLAAFDLLLLGVAVAFLLGQTYFRGRRCRPGVAWCVPFLLIMVGIVLMPISLLAAPLAVGTAFTAHQ